ncbi:MAG: hypothetical protein E6Y28_04455, partial [Staphylococcus epidermidis]|nr:hypothetical protein [Staphylococcus epidermidis]
IIRTPTTSLKTSIKTITNLSDTNCLEIHGASLRNADSGEYLWLYPDEPELSDAGFILCRRVWQPCCAVGFHCDSVQLQIIEIEYYPSLNTP